MTNKQFSNDVYKPASMMRERSTSFDSAKMTAYFK